MKGVRDFFSTGFSRLMGLAALDGALALGWMLHIPSEGGLSTARLGMLGLLLAGTLLPLAGLLPAAQKRLLPRWNALGRDALRIRRLAFWLLLAAFNGAYLLTLPADLTDAAARAILERAAPLLFYLSAVCLEGALLVLPISRESMRHAWQQTAARVALLVFGALLGGWAFVARSGWGLHPFSEYFYEMGVPLLETQFLLAWGLSVAGRKGMEILARRGWRLSARQADALIPLVLYLSTVFLWQSAPTRPTWFFTHPAAPNFQRYPASDALRYDSTAQSALIGNGLQTDNQPRTLRPLYTGLLAVLHTLVGLDYDPVVRAQVWVLALFVVLAYHLGRRMHSRTAGVLLAGLLSLQGYTNIAYANLFTISHARLLMPDLPVAVLMAAFLLLAVRWQGAAAPRWQSALYSGAALGAMLMVRPESITAGIAALLAGLLQWPRQPRLWGRQAAIFALGVGLVTAPWVGRNWARYGKPFFDAPEPRVYIAIRRGLESFHPAPPEPPEPEAVPPTPTPQGHIGTPAKNALPAPPPALPEDLPTRIVQHYLNSEIQSFLALPATFRLPDTLLSYGFLYAQDARLYLNERGENPAAAKARLDRRLYRENTLFWAQCCQLEGYRARLPFWPYPDGLPRQAALLLGVNLLLVALGVGLAMQHLGWAGALPALAHMAYLGGNAVFQVSGGRYIQPVNWIVILYYALGIAALTLGVGKALGWLAGADSLLRAAVFQGSRGLSKGVRTPRRARVLLPLGAVLLLGLAIPIGERLVPRRYSPAVQSRMEEALLGKIPAEVSEGMLVLSGRALYPRYLEAGHGTPDEHPLVATLDYPRLSFFLVGERNLSVRLPLEGLRVAFPNESDVVVIGCPRLEDNRALLDARLVAKVDIGGEVRAVLWRSADVPFTCP
ncbi:MAG TPA: hypothetical protein ENJ02_05250 [Chloroflexi bacterium]|nr:hypothetical protein [Chloroflexota bacterium]